MSGCTLIHDHEYRPRKLAEPPEPDPTIEQQATSAIGFDPATKVTERRVAYLAALQSERDRVRELCDRIGALTQVYHDVSGCHCHPPDCNGMEITDPAKNPKPGYTTYFDVDEVLALVKELRQ